MAVVVSYPAVYTHTGGHTDWSWLWLAGGFFLFSIGLIAWIGINPTISPLRRILAMISDISVTTLGMYVWGEMASPLVMVYFWVTAGNGLRYGPRYLLASMALSVVGFVLILATNPFWIEFRVAGLGLLVGLIAFPLYLLRLLKRLTDAIESAECANKAKSNFLASMSHELRAPLQAIVGMSDLLGDTQLNEKQRHYTKTISVTGMNLAHIIDDILDISKIEAGMLSITPVDFDLHALINNTGALLNLQATKKGLRFLVHIDPNTPYLLHADELRLRQILINLVGNAIKFTEKGHVEIRVSLAREDDEQSWISFAVTDTGPGIPKEAQANVFQRFEQADNSITRHYGGTGLGLTISKELVIAMGGELSLSSEPGVGTTFSFDLPFKRQTIPESTGGLGGRALIISRDRELADQLKEWLDGWGLAQRLLDDIRPDMVPGIIGEGDYTTVLVDERSVPDPRAFAYTVGLLESITRQTVVLIRRRAIPATATLLEAGLSSVLTLPLDKRLTFNAIHAAQANLQDHAGVVPLSCPPETSQQKISLSVLVADDTSVNQTILQEVLQRAGHYPYIVSDGDEAIDALAVQDFDLAIVDLHMPDRTGIDVVKAYRAMDPLGSPMPFIILTADVTPQAKQACMEAEVDMLLAKPIRPHELVEAINQIVERRSAGVRIERRKSTLNVSDNGSPILDYEYLIDLCVNVGIGHDHINEFITNSAAKLLKLETLRTEGKFDVFREVAHALTGNAGTLGASAFSYACRNIEQSSPSYLASEEGARALRHLHVLFDKTHDALTAYAKASSL